MNAFRAFLNTRPGALLSLAAAFALIFNPLTRFPFTFVVIIVFVSLLTWLQSGSLRPLRFRNLSSRDLALLLVVFIILEGFMDFAVQPLVNRVFNEPADYSAFDSLKDNTPKYLKYLVYMWVSAAIGEELLFRAFAMAQLGKITGNKLALNIVLSAVLFCLPHLYQGTAGLVMTFLFGIAFGILFAVKRNIWINILVHGLVDTLFLTLAWKGMLSFYA